MVFLVRVSDFMDGTKQSGVSYGLYLFIGCNAFVLLRGLIMLYKNKFLCMLDFMILPGMVYILINNYLPMIGISFAFKKIDFSVGVWRSAWCGLDNFKYIFTTKDAFIITRNTILYNIVFIVLSNVLGITVGICLAEISSKCIKKFSQTAILLPQLISAVIISYIVFGFLSAESGFINNSILKDNPVDFYNTRFYWPFILVFVYLWKQLGYNSIIYLSSMVGIDRSLYEASYVDGCNRWQQIRYITLPLIKPTVTTLVLLQVGRIFYSDFGLFYQVPMNSGALYRVTNTIDTYVYRSLMQSNNISMAAAASAYQAIIGFALISIVNAIVRKFDKENALF
jgi:ABC-type polysaccharide transport system permease subunit